MADVEPFPPMSNELSQRVARLAKEYVVSHRVPLWLAMREVAAAYPELVAQAREEVLNRKYELKTIGDPANGLTMRICLSAQLSKRAHALAAERNIPFAMALSEIGQKSPELVRAAREQVIGYKA